VSNFWAKRTNNPALPQPVQPQVNPAYLPTPVGNAWWQPQPTSAPQYPQGYPPAPPGYPQQPPQYPGQFPPQAYPPGYPQQQPPYPPQGYPPPGQYQPQGYPPGYYPPPEEDLSAHLAKAKSSKVTDRCPECGSGNMMPPRGRQSHGRCFECGYNGGMFEQTGSQGGLPSGVDAGAAATPARQVASGGAGGQSNYSPQTIVDRIQ
jgi:hypothetical protein